MCKNCETAEAATRQREFELCLLKNMKSIPYEDISVTDLCAQVGIARKIFTGISARKTGFIFSSLGNTTTILERVHSNFL